MRLAVAQMQSSFDPKENLSKSLQLIEEASSDKCDLIIFPEYQLHLPDYNDREKTVAALSDARAALDILTKESKLPAIFNYPEFSNGGIYNTSVLVSNGKALISYRKAHLFNAFSFREENIYTPGTSLPAVTEFSGLVTSFMICYDLRFMEPARMLALDGTDLLAYQAGWFAGERKLDQWKILLRSRAIENGFYVAGSAQTGDSFTGHSMIVNPAGDVLAEMGKEEGICVADISHEEVEKYRIDSGVISGRRNDLYALKSAKARS